MTHVFRTPGGVKRKWLAVTGDEFAASPGETEMVGLAAESQLIVQGSPVWRRILDTAERVGRKIYVYTNILCYCISMGERVRYFMRYTQYEKLVRLAQ